MKPRLKQEKLTYTIDYPEAIKLATTQLNIFWHPDEIAVEKDLHDLKTNLTEAEYHGVVTTLKLFTLYELIAGKEYWSGRVMKSFPRPDIQRMANAFSFFELNVHAPFYAKINECLGLSTDEFYSEYVNDPILRNRMEFIEEIVKGRDDLFSLAVFSIIEGAVLYSSFAFLKHFQSEGKNKLINLCAGINFSVRDENLHSVGGAWLFRTLLQEQGLSGEEWSWLKECIREACELIREHEFRIIDMIFEKGKIEGITETQLKHFVESRIDLCLDQLGLEKMYKPSYNPIAKWFYKNINGGQFHDFFTKVGNEYHRDHNESAFIW